MKIQSHVMVNAPASQAWDVLGEQFAEIGTWTTAIQFSTLEGGLQVGGVRHCHIAAFGPVPQGVIKEQLLEFDREKKFLVYNAFAGMPKFIVWSKPKRPSSCVV
jgi:hypothetical protein